MRILYLCHLTPSTCDYPLFMAQAWERLGHTVELFPADLEYAQDQQARFWNTVLGWNQPVLQAYRDRKVESACKQFNPDVVICGGPFLSPRGLLRLKKKYTCKVGFVLGYNNLLEGTTAKLITHSSFVIAHDSYIIPIIKGVRYGRNPNVFFMPCMADPTEHRPLPLPPGEEEGPGGDVVFIGAWAPDRGRLLEQLIDYDLRIYGYGWEQSEKLAPFVRSEPVYGLKKTRIYGTAKIVLNIQDEEKQINAISNRVPEVLACGGFVLTGWHGDLDTSLLKEGESIACYRSGKDLKEKVEYFLSNPKERVRISQNGQKAVLSGMTYDAVAERLAEELTTLLAEVSDE